MTYTYIAKLEESKNERISKFYDRACGASLF